MTNNNILHHINTKTNKNKIFENSHTNKKTYIILMIIVTYLFMTIPAIFNYGQSDMLVIALIFSTIGFSVLFGLMFSKTPVIAKIFGLIWGLGFGGIPWASIVLPALLQDYVYILIYILGLMSIVVMIICLKFFKKRTKYGNEMLGKLKGFKNFLETAEKDKLESIVMQNPNYFYDILPYTYVLGVSNKWFEKFESISLQSPSWYDGSTNFDVKSFGSFMNNTMTFAQNSMSSIPSSSSGSSGSSGSSSGSSGGGSSGGGSGGGGGGSW